MPYSSRAKYRHEELTKRKLYHIRTIRRGGVLIRVGCPRPQHSGRCPVGTVAKSILHPKLQRQKFRTELKKKKHLRDYYNMGKVFHWGETKWENLNRKRKNKD